MTFDIKPMRVIPALLASRVRAFGACVCVMLLGSCATAPHRVATDDLRWMTPGRPIMGVLGMDCLEHYCVQLDFTSQKMRFLDPERLGDEDLGRASPLSRLFGQVIVRSDLFGERAHFALDSG